MPFIHVYDRMSHEHKSRRMLLPYSLCLTTTKKAPILDHKGPPYLVPNDRPFPHQAPELTFFEIHRSIRRFLLPRYVRDIDRYHDICGLLGESDQREMNGRKCWR